MTGVPHDIASIIARPKGSGQSIGNSSAVALPRNAGLRGLVQLADELDRASPSMQRRDALAPVALVRPRSILAAMRSRMPARRAISMARSRPFSGDTRPRNARYAAARRGVERADVGGQAVVHRGDPVRVGQRPALAVGDRHQRHVVELAVERREVGQVEAAVQRGHASCARAGGTAASAGARRGNAARRTRRRARGRARASAGGAAGDPARAGRGAGRAARSGTRRAAVCESPLANRVTSCPSRTSSSVR